MKTFLILLLAVAVASAAKTHKKRDDSYEANLNDYVDNVVTNVATFVTSHDLDPLALPNVTQSFSEKPLLITYSGRVSLWDGALTNLASTRRFGDIVLSYDNKVLTLVADIGVDKVLASYTYQTKLLSIKTNGAVVGTIKTADAIASLSFDLPNYTATLNSFKVANVNSISAKLSGNVLTDWLANVVAAITVSIVKSDVVSLVEESVTAILEDSLASVNTYLASSVA